ncbi:hypothetical protein BD410DRAFT_443114 [Rickenella mellea]|uniref:Uncharacterized protein n=1 Tax=Rickenella mellea TaxID=50990 RepID=A0A4Y7PVU1_9AGAM|nr:hypothetical protein BD410DRAFT_443114 [Rickenella mellea]
MDGLDDLLKLLTLVKANGWIGAFSEDRYAPSGSQKIIHGAHLPYSEPLSSLREAMQEARVCLKAVEEAQRLLKERLRFLRRLSKPPVLEDGIGRLPDEVLAIIFETGHCINVGNRRQFGLTVSHVSRRFRRVSLQTALLWTHFQNTYGEIQVREFISRSGQLDLTVDLCTSRISERVFKLLCEHSHRWCSLHILNSGIGPVMTKLGTPNFPRLRQLSYCYEIDISTWSMPMLSHVEGWRRILPDKTSLLSQLTHLEFHITQNVDVEDFTLSVLDMKNLKHLSLEILRCELAEDMALSDMTLSALPKPHSIHIDKLEVCLIQTTQQYSSLLFGSLRYLAPTIIDMTVFDLVPTPANFLP